MTTQEEVATKLAKQFLPGTDYANSVELCTNAIVRVLGLYPDASAKELAPKIETAIRDTPGYGAHAFTTPKKSYLKSITTILEEIRPPEQGNGIGIG